MRSMGTGAVYGNGAKGDALKPLKMVGRTGFEPVTNWLKANLPESPKAATHKAFSNITFPLNSGFLARKSLFSKIRRILWEQIWAKEYLVRSQPQSVGLSTTYAPQFWPIPHFSRPFYAGSAGFFGLVFYGDMT